MVAGMVKVVCGTITGVVSLINIVTMLYALMHSNSLQDGKLSNFYLMWNLRIHMLFFKSAGNFLVHTM